jgi:hypothetical protein
MHVVRRPCVRRPGRTKSRIATSGSRYTIALPSAKISFGEACASSERMSFERMMLLELNRGSDGVVGRLHHCGEVAVFYVITV